MRKSWWGIRLAGRGQWLGVRPVHCPCTVWSLLSWRRTEQALLAGCIPVTPVLQRVAVRTMQLASKLGVLVDAWLLWRFPGGTRLIRTFASSALPSMMAWGEQPGFCVRERGGDGAVTRHAQPQGRHSPDHVEAER